MAKWDKEKKVLYHEYNKFSKMGLREVDEPNLLREIFPYNEISKIDFDYRIIPINPAEEIFITDTTFRDGQQARPPFLVKQIVDLFEMLHRLGGPRGIIRQSEFFLYSKKDRQAVEKCREKGYKFPEITGWIRADKKDLKLAKEMEIGEMGILTSVSDYHIFLKLNMTRREALENYLTIVKEALEMGIKPRCHFEDATRSDIYGFCVPFAQELMKLREESGIDVKIRICDTMGYGVTYPGAALPRSVDKMVRAMIDDAGVPGELLEWHGHNDFHKVHINSATAWLYGCAAVNAALLGIGERTGNSPIEGLIIEYASLKGGTDGMDTRVITEIAEYFEREMGLHIPSTCPFVGKDFNATRAGIHADGIMKNEEIYNIFDTKKFLNRPLAVVITDKSGLAGIAYWINTHLGLKGDKQVDKRHPGIAHISKWVSEQYHEGRITAISNEEMEKLLRKYIPELFISEFDRLKLKAREMAEHLLEKAIEEAEMKSMDPKLQEPLMEKLIEENPFIQFAYVVNLEGRMTTRNICNIVDRAKYKIIRYKQDFSNRSWFTEPLRDGKIHTTDFYISRVTGILSITVSGPIRNEEEEVAGILGVDIKFEDLAKMERK
jgi:isopropylmalate/homocitrate/citramalate synthase